MRRLFLSLALVLITAPSTLADLIISEVYPAGSGNGTYGVDWFELTNTGGASIDITGWRMDDNSISFTNSVPFGAEVSSIAAGQSVVFLETSSANFATRVTNFNLAWFGNETSSVVFGSYNGSGVGLGTGGDAVVIFNSTGTIQARVTFGTTTTGFTFDNAAGINGTAPGGPGDPGNPGTISQLSAVGVNGAFLSFNGAEVGSPGTITAIPEPTSILLAGIGGLAGWCVRRRRK